VIVEKIVTEAFAGEPLGAGRVELTFLSDHGPVIYPDQQLVLEATDRRAHYVSFEVEYESSESGSPYRVKRIEALFLLRGTNPIEFELHGPDGRLTRERIDAVAINDASASHIRSQWWESFSSISHQASDLERELHDVLLNVLARRHRLPQPLRAPTNHNSRGTPSQSLEAQFERAVGMLFGIESVKLAMQVDVTLRQTAQNQVADQAIPRQPRMRSLQVPPYHAVPIEAIASRVPAECFYLRTGSLSNYFSFRDFLVGWGGSLDDIVSPRAFDHNVRNKIETQLGLDTSRMDTDQWDHWISDLALIGSDPLFHDGAAVGVLIESSGRKNLVNEIQKQRSRVREHHPRVTERRIEVRNRWVSFVSTPDHRIRSFYVIDGPYHFITNSEHLVDRFLDTADGDRTLGGLNEFRYAKSKARSTATTQAFLYLSDPFFQNLISPHYRIEMTRRVSAKQDLQQIQLAYSVARAEGVSAKSVKELIDARLLTHDFSKRADGSYATYREGDFVDSLRGARGVFLPVPDVPLQKATWAELSGYRRFLADYNREWGRIDPVTVVFSRQENPRGDGLHDNQLEIIVAPYARQRYALLDTHLADANSMQLSPVDGNLISVQAAVRLGRSSPAHLLSIGLQDDEVPFTLEHGKVKRQGENSDTTFAKSRCYAAITPPSTDVLRMLASVLLEGRSRPQSSVPPTSSQQWRTVRLVPLSPNTPAPVQALYYLAWAFGNMPSGALGATKYMSMIDTRNGMTVVSETTAIRDRVHASIKEQRASEPHQVQLTVKSLQGSNVEPYIQAYTYMEARRRSTQSARLLDRWTQWLRLPPDQSRRNLEEVLGAKVCCPLGGNFVCVAEGPARWSSTAWSKPSRFQIDEVAPNWKFPFLDWLQAMTVDFDLEQNTLTASINLSTRGVVNQSGENDRMRKMHTVAAYAASETSEEQLSEEVMTSSFDTAAEGDWILGVRVSRAAGGMNVSFVYPNSPASRADIRTEDFIRRVSGQVPKSPEDLRGLIRDAQEQGFVWIEVERVGSKVRMRVPL
jgi:hypothetical protein